jgi:hypothetical protein
MSRHRLLKALRLVLSLGAVAYIADHVIDLGANATLAAVPGSWVFYAAAALSYVLLPLFEWSVYRRLLGLGPADLLLIYRKRAINEAILDYAGEVEFYLQLRGRPCAAAVVKDVNLLSGAVSNGTTVLLMILLVSTGQLEHLAGAGPTFTSIAIGASIIVGILLALLAAFQGRVLSVARDARTFVLMQYALRLVCSSALMVIQWIAALPDVPLATWFWFLAVWFVAARIPFVPNRDLVFAAIALSLTELVAAPAVTVTGMFLIGGLLPLAGHALVMVATLQSRVHPGVSARSSS